MAVIEAVIENRVVMAARELSKSARVMAVYIFGSHVTGKADEWSDIDIGIFAEGVENWDFERLTRTTVELQRKFGDDLEFHFFPSSALENPEPASFAAFVAKHGAKIRH